MTQEIYKATAPSNIAFLKYWGKSDAARQWPANDSLSMTLDRLRAETTATRIDAPDHVVTLGGERIARDSRRGGKVYRHLDRLARGVGRTERLAITSHNSFPTGSGIASSAAGLAALTIAALAAWHDAKSLDELSGRGFDRDALADWARLGSGSACRSLHGGFVRWHRGNTPDAQALEQIADHAHWPLADIVVIFSGEEKAVGSTEAHEAAWSSPLFAPRLASLDDRLDEMALAIQERSLERLGPLLEQEALEMHAVIMTAEPAVRYLTAEVGEFLACLRRERSAKGIPAYFTMDAGPNVHLIVEQSNVPRVEQFVRQVAPRASLLVDVVGRGPTLTCEASRSSSVDA